MSKYDKTEKINELRQKSGLGFKKCKFVLEYVDWDMNTAIQYIKDNPLWALNALVTYRN